MSHSQKLRRAAMLACGMLALSGSQALADTTANQNVNGTVESYLALTSDGDATVSPFYPGSLATGSSGLHATSTEPGWAVAFVGNEPALGTAGRMDRISCAGPVNPAAVAELSNQLTVLDQTSTPVSITSTSSQLYSQNNTPVASFPIATSYSVSIPATEVLQVGCTYRETVTYTIAVN